MACAGICFTIGTTYVFTTRWICFTIVLSLTVCNSTSLDIQPLEDTIANPRNSLPCFIRLMHTTLQPSICVETCTLVVAQASKLHVSDRNSCQLFIVLRITEEPER